MNLAYLSAKMFTQLFIFFIFPFPTYGIASFFENFQLAFSSWETLLPMDLRKCNTLILDKKLPSQNVTLFTTSKIVNHPLTSTTVFSLDNISNQNLSSLTFSPTCPRNIAKLRNPCTIAYIRGSESSDLLYKVITSLSSILRKHDDYFVFHSQTPSALTPIFSSGPIATFIRYKVGVYYTIPNTHSFITTCFYCGPSATPLLVPLPSLHFSHQMISFNGKVLSVSVATLTGWLSGIRKISPNHYVADRGLLKFSFSYLSSKFNFSGRFFPSTGGGGTGNIFPNNGSWAGAVGDVYNSKADLGFPVGQIFKRNIVVSFLFPVTYDWLAFTTGLPQPHYTWKSIAWPLAPFVWWLTILSSLSTLLALHIILIIAKEPKATPTRAVTYLVALFLEQDKGVMEIRANSTRTLISFWLIFGILMTTCYRSKLVGLITFPVVQHPPKTFAALAQTPPQEYHITLQYLRGAAYSVLKNSRNPTFQTIFSRMQLEESDAKCYQKSIGTIRHACISWANVANYVSNKNLSDANGYVPLAIAPESSTFISISWIFSKEQVWKQSLDLVITWAVAMGLKEKWVRLDNEHVRRERVDWERRDNVSKVEYEDSGGMVVTKALKMENLWGTFYTLWAGGIVACVVALGEKIRDKLKIWYAFNVAKSRCTSVPILNLYI